MTIIDETRRFHPTLRFHECPDQPGYYEAEDLDELRFEVSFYQSRKRLPPGKEQVTRIPLEWVVILQDEYPFFTKEDWTYEHLPQEQRLCLSCGPYYQVGDQVQLHRSAAFYLDRVLGRIHTVIEVFDHHADQVETGGLPEYRPEEGRIYRLEGLPALISHRALQRQEPPVLVRLFQKHQKHDVRIVSYAPYVQRQAVSLSPEWDAGPDDGAWLNTWHTGHKSIYLYFTIKRAQAELAAYGINDPLSYLEHATFDPLTGEVNSVYACTSDGQRLYQFWYSPWEDEEIFFDKAANSSAISTSDGEHPARL